MFQDIIRSVRPIDKEFAQFISSRGGSESVAAAGALLSFALSRGDTCINIKTIDPTDLWDESQSIPPFPSDRESWISEINESPLVSSDGNSSLLTIRQNRVYLSRYFKYEQCITHRLKENLTPQEIPSFSEETIKVMRKLFKTDTDFSDFDGDLQLAGSLIPLFFPLSILSGGPGTGKTTTVAKLLALLLTHRPETRIALAAPTGKAAQRMSESIRGSVKHLPVSDSVKQQLLTLEPSTIHRLLGVKYLSPSFKKNRDNQLETDLLVIDEASMIDLPLLAKLFDAVPESCSIILLGDQFQLASVEAGSVLGDICSAIPNNQFSKEFCHLHSQFSLEINQVSSGKKFYPVVQFTRSFRFDPYGGVGKVSRLINNGEISIAAELNDPEGEVILRKNQELSDYIALSKGIRTAPTAETALERLTEGMILTVRNEGDLGQEGINNAILSKLKKSGDPFLHNMPIMITENSYDISLFNGDMGVIRKENGEWIACFSDDSGFRTLPVVLLPEWQPAFAITIHKSQGSEYRKLIIVLGDSDSSLLTRELVYTAITRAKPKEGEEAGSVIIQGTPELLAKGIARKVHRSSGLQEELAALIQ